MPEYDAIGTGQRIRQCRKKAGMTQQALAEALSLNKSTVHRYEAGQIATPKMPVIAAIAHALCVNARYLLGQAESPKCADGLLYENLFTPVRRSFPLLGDIACGAPLFTDEQHESFVVADGNMQADFCLRAKGDSMTGARIFDGDVVFIRKQDEVENGEIAAVIVGDEATLKRVFYDRRKNKLVLNAENPKYEPMVFAGDELGEIHILGKAVAFQSRVF